MKTNGKDKKHDTCVATAGEPRQSRGRRKEGARQPLPGGMPESTRRRTFPHQRTGRYQDAGGHSRARFTLESLGFGNKHPASGKWIVFPRKQMLFSIGQTILSSEPGIPRISVSGTAYSMKLKASAFYKGNWNMMLNIRVLF